MCCAMRRHRQMPLQAHGVCGGGGDAPGEKDHLPWRRLHIAAHHQRPPRRRAGLRTCEEREREQMMCTHTHTHTHTHRHQCHHQGTIPRLVWRTAIHARRSHKRREIMRCVAHSAANFKHVCMLARTLGFASQVRHTRAQPQTRCPRHDARRQDCGAATRHLQQGPKMALNHAGRRC